MSSKRPKQSKRMIAPSNEFDQSWLDVCNRIQEQPSKAILNWFGLLHTWDFISAKATQGKPQWTTESRHPLCAKTLYLRWQSPGEIVGVRFNTRIGGTTQYGLIDIDVGSDYHPYQDESSFLGVLASLEAVGLCRYIIIRSSDSEGLHVYFPFTKAVSCSKLALLLKQTISQAGYAIALGQLELFPNVRTQRRTLYQAHRLPLQIGSYVLDDSFQPVHNSIDRFVEAWNQIADQQDIAKLEEAIANVKFGNYRGSSKDSEEWRIRLEGVLAEGWTAHGQTNNIIRDVCIYARVFKKLSWSEIVSWAVKTVVSLPGYYQYCRHQHDIRRRVRDWVKVLKAKGYRPYSTVCKGQRKPKGSGNDERKADARKRIEAAIAQIEREQGGLPKTVHERQRIITKIARCSIVTLRKHPELWHPAKMDKGCVPADTTSVSAIFEQGSTLPQIANESEVHPPGHPSSATLGDLDVKTEISDPQTCVPVDSTSISAILERGLESKQSDEAIKGCVLADSTKVSVILRRGYQTEEMAETQPGQDDTHHTLLSVNKIDRDWLEKSQKKTLFSYIDEIAARREEIFTERICINSIVRHREKQKIFKVKRVNPNRTVWASYMFEVVPLVDVILHLSELELVTLDELQAMTDKTVYSG